MYYVNDVGLTAQPERPKKLRFFCAAVNGMKTSMELHDGRLFLSDYATGRIYAFGLDGTLHDWLETGFSPNSIMGMEFDEAGSLYVVDHTTPQVIKISLPQ